MKANETFSFVDPALTADYAIVYINGFRNFSLAVKIELRIMMKVFFVIAVIFVAVTRQVRHILHFVF